MRRLKKLDKKQAMQYVFECLNMSEQDIWGLISRFKGPVTRLCLLYKKKQPLEQHMDDTEVLLTILKRIHADLTALRAIYVEFHLKREPADSPGS